MYPNHEIMWGGERVSVESSRDPAVVEKIISTLRQYWVENIYYINQLDPLFHDHGHPENDPLFSAIEYVLRQVALLWPTEDLPYLSFRWGDPNDAKSFAFFYTEDGSEFGNEEWHDLHFQPGVLEAQLQALKSKKQLEAVAKKSRRKKVMS